MLSLSSTSVEGKSEYPQLPRRRRGDQKNSLFLYAESAKCMKTKENCSLHSEKKPIKPPKARKIPYPLPEGRTGRLFSSLRKKSAVAEKR